MSSAGAAAALEQARQAPTAVDAGATGVPLTHRFDDDAIVGAG
jgi:hypothetical protein